MMRSVYDLERLFALEHQEREAQVRHERRVLEAHGVRRRPSARLAFVAYVLTLFRLA